jgi:predicted RNA-binding Zn-ribbon protein involved in translation (DUF1610 family)
VFAETENKLALNQGTLSFDRVEEIKLFQRKVFCNHITLTKINGRDSCPLSGEEIWRCKMVRAYLKERNNMLRVVYFPKGSPEFNAIEEC